MINAGALTLNMMALMACVIAVEPNTYVASTPEQAFQALEKGEVKFKIDQDDKVDIYKMITGEQTGEFSPIEKDKSVISMVQENYNITKDDINSAIKWVEKNRKDVVKKYDNQVNMFGMLGVI